MSQANDYIELHASSAFSFLAGASQPEALAERAAAARNARHRPRRPQRHLRRSPLPHHGHQVLVKAHIGAEIAVSSFGNTLTPPDWLPHQYPSEPPRLLLLCASQIGYQNLCQLITRFKMRETTKAEGAATLDDLEEFSAGLICLTGGDEGPLAAALAHKGRSEACKIVTA
jgi:error-prone DNA polymerase